RGSPPPPAAPGHAPRLAARARDRLRPRRNPKAGSRSPPRARAPIGGGRHRPRARRSRRGVVPGAAELRWRGRARRPGGGAAVSGLPVSGARLLAGIARRTALVRALLAIVLVALVLAAAAAARHPAVEHPSTLPVRSGDVIVLDLSASIS